MVGAIEAVVTSPSPARPSQSSGPDYDGLLVRVAVSADKAAFQELYAHFAPRVKGFLMRNGSTSAELADDLAQETLLKVWRKAKLFDPSKASASTWIFTIARNLRIDAARRAAKPPLDPDDPTFHPPEEPQGDVVVERRERDQQISAAFASLPANQHEVVRLHFMEDAAHSEIAERLNLPLGTVKSRLRLAFEKIRKELGDFDA